MLAGGAPLRLSAHARDVGLMIYAVTDAHAVLPSGGPSDAGLRLFREGALGAVVRDVRRVPDPAEENLRQYDRTMRRLAESTRALLPVRFGTYVDDPAELRYILRSRHDTLRQRLAHVRNRVQMTLHLSTRGGNQVTSGEGPHQSSTRRGHEVPAASGRPVRRGDGTRHLRERAEAAARARDVPQLSPVRPALGRWIRDERVERRPERVSVYHLIPRASAAAYQRVVARSAARTGVPIVVTGPWPPYAFAEEW